MEEDGVKQSSGHGRSAVPMNSQQLWLPARNQDSQHSSMKTASILA